MHLAMVNVSINLTFIASVSVAQKTLQKKNLYEDFHSLQQFLFPNK
jgi:hypothetical protein